MEEGTPPFLHNAILNLFLVWYLENTVVTGYGVRKSPCFCCEKEYRKGSKASAADVIPAAGVTGSGVEAPVPTADLDAMPADVRAGCLAVCTVQYCVRDYSISFSKSLEGRL